MQILDQLEIFIPVEAEVRSIPLWSLPGPVLRRMGFSEPDGPRRLSDSPEGVWICPAVLRRKGHKPPIQNASSLLDRACRAAPGPFQMSFRTNNRAAYRLLEGTMPGRTASAEPPNSSPPPPVRAPGANRAAVVIYNGQVYLSVRRTNQREAREAPPASRNSGPPEPEPAAKRQKAPLEPADKQPPKKKLHVALPQDSLRKLRDIITKRKSASTTDQEPRPQQKPRPCPASQSEVGNVSSSRPAAPPDPRSSDGLHSEDPRRAAEGPLPAAEAPPWFQPEVGGHGDVRDDQEADYMDGDGEEPDHGQTWTGSRSTFDFELLEEEEEIERMKAKLRQREAELYSLHAS